MAPKVNTSLSLAAELLFPSRRSRVLAVEFGERWCLGFLDSPGRTIQCCLAENREQAAKACGARRLRLAEGLISYPRTALTHKTVVLPTTDREEAGRMVGYELPDLLPYEEEELVYDYHLAPAEEVGCSRASIFAGRADTLQSAFDELGRLGVSAEAAVPTSVAYFRWYRTYRGTDIEGPEALIVVSRDGAEVLVVDGEDILFSRAFAEVGTADSSPQRLATELARSFDLYQRDSGSGPLSRVSVVCDDPALAQPVLDAAGDVCPVVVPLTENEPEELLLGYVIEGAETVPLSRRLLLVGMGLPAEGADAGTIALAPTGVVESRERLQRRRKALANVAMLSINLLLGFVLLSSAVRGKSLQLEALDQRRRELAPVAGELNDKRSQLALLKSALHRRHLALRVIGELHRITPTEVAVTRLVVDEDGHVRLDGTARELSQVFDFIRILEDSPQFESVAYGHSVMSTVGNRQYVTFYLEMDSRT